MSINTSNIYTDTKFIRNERPSGNGSTKDNDILLLLVLLQNYLNELMALLIQNIVHPVSERESRLFGTSN